MTIRFVSNPFGNGWMLAAPNGVNPAAVVRDSRLGISVPWCHKVDLLKTEGGRDYFEIVEGVLKGTKASIKLRDTGGSYLTADDPHLPAGTLRLSRKTQRLWFGAQGPFSAFSEFSNPVALGIHDIEIPDAPHENFYPESSKYQQVWFRIGHSGDRYLHLGTISHGCATVRPWLPDKVKDRRFAGRTDAELGLPATEPVAKFARWDDICTYLMPRRKRDGKSVGTLHVED